MTCLQQSICVPFTFSTNMFPVFLNFVFPICVRMHCSIVVYRIPFCVSFARFHVARTSFRLPSSCGSLFHSAVSSLSTAIHVCSIILVYLDVSYLICFFQFLSVVHVSIPLFDCCVQHSVCVPFARFHVARTSFQLPSSCLSLYSNPFVFN